MPFTPPPPYVPGHNLLAGKSVLITAAAGAGIGFAAATRAAEEGARAVMISDIHAGRLAQAAAEACKRKPDWMRSTTNWRMSPMKPRCRPWWKTPKRSMEGVDVLINNAGLGGSRLLVEMTDEEWGRVLDITLNGTMRMTRAMLRKMQPRGSGVIVNNASVLGWRAQREQCHYAAAKAGVMALTRCAALEAADFGVRINAVSPSIAFHEFLKKTTPPAAAGTVGLPGKPSAAPPKSGKWPT